MRVADYLGLEHNVTIASAAVFLIGFGEELWKKFLPKYLEALGATTPIIGLFGTAEDFFDACYQYPGGFVADRFGRRRAFLIFITLASLGYLVYLFSTSWPFLFVGLALVMAWQSMASPAIFAVIGDSLPRERRAMGFTLQSILKTCAYSDRANCWRCSDRLDGLGQRYPRWPADHTGFSSGNARTRTQNQNSQSAATFDQHARRLALVSWRTEAAIDFRHHHQNLRGYDRGAGNSLCDQHSRHQCRGLRHSHRHSDDHFDPCLHSGQEGLPIE